ncbi:MAG: hypothetical protein QOK23_4723 [Gammaproteobacteria bacterium]|jgi:hypothetical protein|nr:hypothetical protein [Gammaproteobacteria bacterium]
MPYNPPAEFSALYKAYTGDPDSMGSHLTARMRRSTDADPLLVITGSDAVLFPGSGQTPSGESFRKSTRGFIELASVSHLGTAVAWLARLRELDDPVWRQDAERLITQLKRTRQINTRELWQDEIAVPALVGCESKIADLVDYGCAVTERFLEAGLADESLMDFECVRTQYLDPAGSAAVPVPINDLMVATFALAFLDIGHRIIRWVRRHVNDWDRLMVLLSGRSGRPTAGLSWTTNNMCHLLWKASNERLPPERVFIAPHAPSFILSDIKDDAHLQRLSSDFRDIWTNTRASIELARSMFQGYPAYDGSAVVVPTALEIGSRSMNEMPALRSPDDRYTAIARLRLVMEDPRQLLANSVASYVIDQLCAADNDPSKVFIPGFTNVAYPRRG